MKGEMPRVVLALTVAVVAALPRPRLAAQAAPEPGSVVRVYVQPPAASPVRPGGPPVEGTLVASDSIRLLLVREDGDTLTVPRATIRELYLRSKGSPPVLKGAMLGAVVGGLAGLLIGSQIEEVEVCDATACFMDGVEYAPGAPMDTVTKGVAGLTAGALIGGVAGAILGARSKGYRWTRVGSDQFHFGVLPAGRGMRVGLSASF